MIKLGKYFDFGNRQVQQWEVRDITKEIFLIEEYKYLQHEDNIRQDEIPKRERY